MAQRRPVSGKAGEVATLDDEDEKKTKALQPTTPDLTRGLLICTGLVVCQTIVDVVIEIPKVNGKLPFSPAALTLLNETAKLLLAVGVLLTQSGVGGTFGLLRSTTVLDWAKFSVPALIYCIQNNMVLYAHSYLANIDVIVLLSSKYVLNAVVYLIVFRRTQSRKQWLSLVVISVGSIVSQLGHRDMCSDAQAADGGIGGLSRARVVGITLTLLTCCCSAVAGVYTELLLKTDKSPMMWQSVRLYIFGLMLNSASYHLEGRQFSALLDGFVVEAWVYVVFYAFYGVLVSLVLKHVDIFAKQFSVTVSTFVTTIISAVFLNIAITHETVLGIVNASAGMMLYYI